MILQGRTRKAEKKAKKKEKKTKKKAKEKEKENKKPQQIEALRSTSAEAVKRKAPDDAFVDASQNGK